MSISQRKTKSPRSQFNGRRERHAVNPAPHLPSTHQEKWEFAKVSFPVLPQSLLYLVFYYRGNSAVTSASWYLITRAIPHRRITQSCDFLYFSFIFNIYIFSGCRRPTDRFSVLITGQGWGEPSHRQRFDREIPAPPAPPQRPDPTPGDPTRAAASLRCSHSCPHPLGQAGARAGAATSRE